MKIAALVHHGSDADNVQILEKQLPEWKGECARLRTQLEVRNAQVLVVTTQALPGLIAGVASVHELANLNAKLDAIYNVVDARFGMTKEVSMNILGVVRNFAIEMQCCFDSFFHTK